ncbi:MAG: type VI secretion system protein TssA [Planctomycetes bacterium]|jgi:type VI secretion system protein ImpA|nr:type VI secretion system protein TssA [Planctomycetota bacterium]
MAAIDVDRLLGPVTPDSPAGENMEYTPAFRELEQAAQGKPEQQIGDTRIPAEDPDWKTLREKALVVLGESRDLRAAMYLLRALAHMDGLPGMAQALALVRGLHEQFWETFHPQLDPEDDNDPTMRLNCLNALCDPATTLKDLRLVPVVSSRALGRFCLRDIQWVTGEMPVPEGVTAPSATTLDGAFADCEVDELKRNEAAAGACVEHVTAIEAFLTEKLGAMGAVSLDDFTSVMSHIRKLLAERLARRGVVVAGGSGPAVAAAGAGGAAVAQVSAPGTISGREDAIRMLDQIGEWFARNEPSSPVPLLLMRAKRLVSRTFLEILKDMAPDGLPQAEKVGGVDSSTGTGY